MEPELKVGSMVKERGFCTHAFLLRGRPPELLETLLGFRTGRLSEGAVILFLEEPPSVDDFELAGFTYFSDGAVQGHSLDDAARDPYRMESLLRTQHGWSEYDIREYKRRMIGRKLVIQGPDRLAKLVPAIPHTKEEEYPPGSGIFQVKIVRPLQFRVEAVLRPGEKWKGGFSGPT